MIKVQSLKSKRVMPDNKGEQLIVKFKIEPHPDYHTWAVNLFKEVEQTIETYMKHVDFKDL